MLPSTIPLLIQGLISQTVTTASTAIPPDAQNVALNGTMSDADASNESLSCVWGMEFSYDGLTFETLQESYAINPWRGGINSHGKPNHPNLGVSIPVNAQNVRAVAVRGHIDPLGNTLNTGAEAKLT